MIKAATLPLLGQPAVQSLNSYFKEVRAGKSPPHSARSLQLENAKSILTALSAYSKDTLVLIRSKAALITRVVGTKSTVVTIRQ